MKRDPARLLAFAMRCGDEELSELLLPILARAAPASPSPLAARTYARLESRLGIAPTH